MKQFMLIKAYNLKSKLVIMCKCVQTAYEAILTLHNGVKRIMGREGRGMKRASIQRTA